MGAFKVLMWKHYTVRKRRLFQTFIEHAAPISMVVVLFLLKAPMQAKNKIMFRESPTHRLSVGEEFSMPRIAFSPDSEAACKLIDAAKEQLGLSQAKGWAKIGIKSSDSNTSHLDDWQVYEVFIQFENMTGSSLPDTLSYNIGLKPSLDSNILALTDYRPFEDYKEPLLRLQWAIDSSFLKLKSPDGQNIQNISFEKLTESPEMRTVEPLYKKNVDYLYVNSVFYLLPYLSFLGPMLPFIFLMIRLLEERSSGIQELVKMVGVSPSLLGITQFLNSLSPVLSFSVIATLLLKYDGDNAMIPATDGILVFTGLFLHFISMVALAYASSFIAKDAQYTVSLSMFVYIGCWVPVRLIGHESKSKTNLFFLGLLPHCPTYWYLNEMHNTEIYYGGTGIHTGNWMERYGRYLSGGWNGCVLASYLMQLLQITIFFTVSWYLERVRPGKYGIALPWNFLFKKDYWRRTHDVIPEKTIEKTATHEADYDKYFEEPPTNTHAGIKISHVSKIFGSGAKQCHALDNVTFDIYRGEITVLLGHNGAGKTTIMSIITGMYNPTAGKIYVNGMDTVTQQQEVRKHLGLCPQHNLFFPDLTVKEHFLFFSMIKGGTFHDADKSSRVLMQQLELTDKADSKTSELSGGLLRRLQLGCALCGNASVLILDEPTSGLDVEARRELWDILLALRGDRTLVLSTHFMEEADVLGDRVAALHLGKLKCHATPMFLKRAVGSGFRLSITTTGNHDEAKITQTIQSTVGNAVLKEKTDTTLIYDLPAGANLPNTFQNLEKRKAELDIVVLSVGITTLEEVFLELCCDVDKEIKSDDLEDTSKTIGQDRYVGCRRMFRQSQALFRRQFDYTMSKKTAFFILQIVMPFTMCTVLTELFNNLDLSPYASRRLNLGMYSESNQNKALFRLITNNTKRSNTIEAMQQSYPKIEFKGFEDLHNSSCTCGKTKKIDYKNFLIGIDVNDTEAKVFYQPTVPHSASVGLNFLSNVLAMQRMPNATEKTISTSVSHYRLVQKPPKIHQPKSKMNCALFAIFNIFIMMATAINDVTLPCRERITVARHTHIMAGCPPALYWTCTFIYQMTTYCMFCVTAALFAAYAMENDKTVDDKGTLSAYAVALIVCGMDFYAFSYFISILLNERGASIFLIGMTLVFGFLSPILMMALDDLRMGDDPEPIFNRIMSAIGIVLPAHMFTEAVSRMTDTSRFNSYCRNNYAICSKLPYLSEGFDKDKCCNEGSTEKGPWSHFAFTKFAMGFPLVIVCIQFIVFATLLLLLEYRYFNRWWNNIGRMRATSYPPKQFQSDKVAQEKEFVEKTMLMPKKEIQETLLMHNAWKIYYRLFGIPTFAVRDVNFSVAKGECFGLLGANGAGKTTTFKLIAYQEAATKGDIFVGGHYLTSNPTQYMHGLGYCPQFCGLDDFRSGANNLRMLLLLRGYKDEDVRKETSAWLRVVGMEKYGHRQVVGYSGGMVRRLATCASLCSGTALTLLDEPTAGVDTAARRVVWEALKRGTLNDRAIVLTSHSMDEMEMLCKRVTILTNGEMCVMGTPAELREEHAPGNRVVLKLHVAVVQSPIGPERVQNLKDALEQKFDCTLKDSHMTSLHYRINENLPYSDMFKRMADIEAQFTDLLEDYSVSDTTLEDVFLTFSSH